MAGSRSLDGEAVDRNGKRYWTLGRAQKEAGFALKTLRKYLANYESDRVPQLTPVHNAVVVKLFDGPAAPSGGRPVTVVVQADEVVALRRPQDAEEHRRTPGYPGDTAGNVVTEELQGGQMSSGRPEADDVGALRRDLVAARAQARQWENLFRIEQAARIAQDERARDQLSLLTGPPDPEDLAASAPVDEASRRPADP